MHVILLGVGVFMAIVGAVLIRYGVPLDEYGNSPLLMSGMVALTGGMLLIGLFMVARNLSRIAERLEIQPMPLPPMADIARSDPPPRPAVMPPPPVKIEPVPLPEAAAPEPKTEPKIEPRAEPRIEPVAASAPVPATTPRQPAEAPKSGSLFGALFGGNKRKPVEAGRKESAALPSEPSPAEPAPLTGLPEPEPTAARPSPAPADNGVAPPKPAAPGAEVYKSGVIDGMAYTLYVDGSIEAELPQGTIRFASVEELQKYLTARSA
jgi:hypothetical protein